MAAGRGPRAHLSPVLCVGVATAPVQNAAMGDASVTPQEHA